MEKNENIQKEELHLQIKQESWRKVQEQYSKKFKKNLQKRTFLVVASLSLVHTKQQTFQLVAIGFGTKSLPNSVINTQNKQDLLQDMHAEMLVFQEFKRYILQQFQVQNSPHLTWNDKKQKYSLNSDYQIYLYCSQIFCGDCCVNQQYSSFSGAKPLKYLKQPQYPDMKYEENVLRTKPGRLDLPVEKRSSILSCSDLIALTNILGLQGRKLFTLLTPIYLSTIILDTSHKYLQSIRKGINFQHRLALLTNKSLQLIHRKIFNIIINGKQRKISSQFRANEPQIIILDKTNDRNRQGFELCGIIAQDNIEWINGKTGLPEGSSLKNYKTKGKTSRCCESKLTQNYLRYKEDQNTFKYDAIQNRLQMLFQEWINY